MTNTTVRFGVLGPLLVERDGVAVSPPRSSVLRGLLGVLLLTGGRPIAAGRLADLVWTGRADRTGKGALQVAVSRLRGWLRELDEDLTVAHDAGGYRLAVDPASVDLLRLRAGLELARANPRPAARCALLAPLLELVRGPVLADLEQLDQTHPVLRAAQATVQQAGLMLGEAALLCGDPEAALGPLRALVETYPLDEPMHACLIRVLAACGRPDDALACYERLRERLAETLGVSPSRQVQEARLAVAGDRPDAGPERGAGAAGGLAGHLVVPAQLPADLAEFTGREGEVGRLDELVSAGAPAGPAVVTIVGTAGVGKTALAVHWAHRARHRFPDGQLYVDLQGYATGPPLRPIRALAQLLHALGVDADGVPVEVEAAAELYHSRLAGTRTLVVLDNARDAEQVLPLLPPGPGPVTLVTSRDRLAGLATAGVDRRLSLDVLTPAEAGTLLRRILAPELVAREPEAAAELARVCGYLPLAVRIAAANLGSGPERPIAGYLAELRAADRLSRLAVAGDTRAAVGAAFDRSYERLTRPGRRLFRLLSLAPGPRLTVGAAAALAGTPVGHAARLLDRLAGAHLVERREPGRLGLHDLLRLYGRDLVDREDGQREREAAVERLLGWYLRNADAAARLLYPDLLRLPLVAPETGPRPAFDDHTGALAWLDAERANLVAAVQHAAEQGPRPVAWLLADTLRGYFWLRRHTVEWLAVARAGLAAAADDAEARAQAALLLSIGDAEQTINHHDLAIEHYAAALPHAREADWLDGQAAALGNMGRIYLELGDLDRAAEHHGQALAFWLRTARQAGQATALLNLATVNRQLGHLERAAEDLGLALALYRSIGSRSGEAAVSNNLGAVSHDLGRLGDALEHLTVALEVMRETGDRYGEANTLFDLAAVHRDAGRHGRALELARAALAMARETGDRRTEAAAQNALGSVHFDLNRPHQALDCFEVALEIAREIGSRADETSALLGQSATHLRFGDADRAADRATMALDLATESGFRVLEGRARAALAGAYLGGGDHARAAEHARLALAVNRRTGHRVGEARALVVLGHAARATGADAEAHWHEALRLLDEMGSQEADRVRVLLEG